MHSLAHEGPDTAVCASRASALALTQTRLVAAKLAQFGIPSTILNITTAGDRDQQRTFAAMGEQNIFVTELEIALREGRAHYAVHSCKDLPSTLPDDMELPAISQREDPRDVFCSERYERFSDLPAGASVGTSSMRRRAQLAALRADLQYTDMRGNVDTRLRKLREGQYDAIVLAAAGLHRLGVRAKHMQAFTIEELVPAAGQGALAVETLVDAQLAPQLRKAVNDEQTERAVHCERAALAAMRGGCQAPIGIHAYYEDEMLVATGAVANDERSPLLRDRLSEPAPTLAIARALGEKLAARLLCAK